MAERPIALPPVAAGKRMPAKKSLPHIPGLILRPACPKCSTAMELTRTAQFKGHAGIQELSEMRALRKLDR
jgi:hypothetical protein